LIFAARFPTTQLSCAANLTDNLADPKSDVFVALNLCRLNGREFGHEKLPNFGYQRRAFCAGVSF
jgi:hypothetical protein